MAADNKELNDSKDGKENVVFTVNNIYIKDVSFEAPTSPEIFSEDWQPKLNFDLETKSRLLQDNFYEVVLSFTVTVKIAEDKVAFLIEVKQAGIFNISGLEEEILKRVLATACPNILFPYVREIVSSMATRGGFPQLVLPPINFDAVYAEQQNG